jgi:hypothetical protein
MSIPATFRLVFTARFRSSEEFGGEIYFGALQKLVGNSRRKIVETC